MKTGEEVRIVTGPVDAAGFVPEPVPGVREAGDFMLFPGAVAWLGDVLGARALPQAALVIVPSSGRSPLLRPAVDSDVRGGGVVVIEVIPEAGLQRKAPMEEECARLFR